jgi:hypothetical protein
MQRSKEPHVAIHYETLNGKRRSHTHKTIARDDKGCGIWNLRIVNTNNVPGACARARAGMKDMEARMGRNGPDAYIAIRHDAHGFRI